VLRELALAVPSERKYRAYRHYARGQAALARSSIEEARSELERAISASPELEPARRALDGLPAPTRRT
jgi:hypothetical protein